jgi:hypothetical protein
MEIQMHYYLYRLNLRKIFTDWVVVLFIAIGACYIGNAQATNGGEGDNTSCNGVGNPNSPCVGGQGGSGGNGGNGGNGGTGTGGNATNTNSNTATGGTGIGLGGNSIASAGSTVTSTTSSVALGQGGNAKGGNANSNSNATGGQAKQDQNQRQAQGQEQGQHQQSDAHAAVNGSGNGGVSQVAVDSSNHQAAQTASAVPTTVIQSDSCQTGYAVGGQAVAFGISLSGTKADENCERIKLWRELRAAGYNKEALSLLMQDERVAKAFGKTKQANNEYEGKEIASYR